MFDQIVLVKIIEMQNEADRRRWRNNEDAFYRDLGRPFAAGFIQFWHRLRQISATDTEKQKRTGGLPAGPLLNVCSDACNQAAR